MATTSKRVTSKWAVLAAAVLLPPLGLVLLWRRAKPGLALKILASVGILVMTVIHLAVFFELRFELDGTGSRPIFRFGTRESHFEEVEESRAVQVKEASAVSAAAPLAAPPAVVKDAYWTDYRGPDRAGHYREMEILTQWPPQGLPLLWRQPVGEGYASMVVAGGRAFTIEQRRNQEVVAAYDMETGREVWTNAWNAHFQEAMGGPGPRATPTWHEGRVYALGAEGEFRCLDARTGSVIWRKNILRDNGVTNLQWGMAASPLVVDEKVIVLPGGRGKSVVAYHKVSGELLWSVLDDDQSYTAPMEATLAGKRQLIVVSATRAMGLTIEEGRLLWEFPWRTSYDINAAQPLVVGDNRVYISAGYGHGAALWEVTRSGESFATKRIWETNRMKNKFSSAVLFGGHVYGLDEAILACVDAATGQQKWKGERYGYGQLLLASGHLVVITEQGELVLVRATPERHEEVSRFQAIRGKTWNVPAMAGGKLLVRNTLEMACFRIAR